MFDHLTITHSKLLQITINTTCEKIAIVSSDRDCSNLTMNLTIVLDDFLLSDVYLFLMPLTI